MAACTSCTTRGAASVTIHYCHLAIYCWRARTSASEKRYLISVVETSSFSCLVLVLLDEEEEEEDEEEELLLELGLLEDAPPPPHEVLVSPLASHAPNSAICFSYTVIELEITVSLSAPFAM